MSRQDGSASAHKYTGNESRDDEDIDELIKALSHSPDRNERIRAAEALGRIGEPAIEPLMEALREERWDTRSSAIAALEKIGLSAADVFHKALTDDDWFVRAAAAKALGQIKDPNAVQSLIGALSDKKWFVRERAAEALGRIGEPAIEPLMEALKDRHGVVRERAAEILGRIGDARCMRPLADAFKDAELYVQARAVLAFERIKKRTDEANSKSCITSS